MRPEIPIEKKFWSKVEQIPFHSCWEWVGLLNFKGYGYTNHKGKTIMAHRLSLSLHNIPLQENLVVDHVCMNKTCVNPNHLRQVTSSQNNLENSRCASALNAQKTKCVRGHKLTLRNSPPGRTWRRCVICNNNQLWKKQ